MANIAATVSNLHIDGHTLVCTIAVTGDPGGKGEPYLWVYDAAGTERSRSDLGVIAAGESWDATLDLPHGLPDGDYGAWIQVLTTATNGDSGPLTQEGVSFLVGRGEIYPSREQADKPGYASPPTISALRLEGTWLVFDMTNEEHYDVEVTHQFSIAKAESGTYQTFHGQELVRAGKTQQAHYLLPEHLEDGAYTLVVEVSTEGSVAMMPAVANIEVRSGVITMV
jgi:hypothetical protein